MIKLVPRGYFLTPIKAQTIYGQLVWLIYMTQGQEAASSYIYHMRNRPFFVLSDAFPFGSLPVFNLIRLNNSNRLKVSEMREEISLRRKYKKQFKRLRFVNIVDIEYMLDSSRLYDGKDLEDVESKIQDYLKRNIGVGFYVHERIGNVIDRLKNSTAEGGIFSYKQKYVKDIDGKNRMWIFVSILDEGLYNEFKIEELLRKLFTEWGFSKRRNVGFGFYDFSLMALSEVSSVVSQEGFERGLRILHKGLESVGDNGVVASLSDFVPSENEMVVDQAGVYGGWRLDVKYGKYSDIVQQVSSVRFFKIPVVTLTAGSIVSTRQARGYLGRVVDVTPRGAHITEDNIDPGAVAFGFYYGLPFNIEAV